MAKLTLKLLTDSYDQPTLGRDREPTGKLTTRTRGEVFEATGQEEYDRLTELGDAVDPRKAQERQAEELRDRREQLEAEREQLDRQLKGLRAEERAGGDPSELKGKALDDALTAHGLSVEGSADEKRQRLAEFVEQNPPAAG